MPPKILIAYSNPPDTRRLRLGDEHRRVDEALRDARLDESLVRRIHASSLDDLCRELRSHPLEIVQFSGHGSPDGIALHGDAHGGSTTLSAAIAGEILRDTCPNLRAALFLACYSGENLRHLSVAAPFLISVYGKADDLACLEFAGEFYKQYFATDSIQQAFSTATLVVEAKGRDLGAVLTRRAAVERTGPLLVAFPGLQDSILVDIAPAAEDIRNLGITQDQFMQLISRKLRVHLRVFRSPSDRTVLSLGRYFVMLAWENAHDVVECQRVLRIRDDVDQVTFDAWASVSARYNDRRVDRYRTEVDPVAPEMERHLKLAVDEYHRIADSFFGRRKIAQALRSAAPEQFKLSRGLVRAYLEICDAKLHQGDLAAVVENLELMLSAIHNLLDDVTDRIAVAA